MWRELLSYSSMKGHWEPMMYGDARSGDRLRLRCFTQWKKAKWAG
jgi:hypothetical protein